METGKNKISAILLAGGEGKRMGLPTPKQFLMLGEKPILTYSLELFASLDEIGEIIVVADKQYHALFSHDALHLAQPGKRRQDSLFNGLSLVHPKSQWILVHDAARPFVGLKELKELIREGQKVGAATLATPVKATIKEGEKSFALRTLDRERLFEIQTPQLIKKNLLIEGFKIANEKKLTVTDDVSLVELLGHPVKLVQGNFSNIKITTQEDLIIAHAFINLSK